MLIEEQGVRAGSNVISLESRRAKRGAIVATDRPLASVAAFTLVRHTAVLQGIVREMLAAPTERKAEDILVGHLEIEIDRLLRAGTGEAEALRVAREFGRAAWALYDRRDNGEIVA